MIGEIMKIFAYVYFFTWIVWPFAFIFGVAYGIKELIETKDAFNKGFIIASVALLFILAGIVYPLLSS